VIPFDVHKRLEVMKTSVPSVAAEFAGLKLGDSRLRERVQSSVARLSAAPDLGFPRALGTEKATEGFYRLLTNSKVKYGRLVEAHAQQTIARMRQGSTVRVIHDTTEFSFSGETASRDGLGRLHGERNQGFLAHVAFAVEAESHAKPLGVVGAICWARTAPPRMRGRKVSGEEFTKIDGKESLRWRELASEVEHRVSKRCSLLHLMDREADSYPLFCRMNELGARFVIRMARDRVVESQHDRMPLSEALIALPKILEREVPLSRRAAKPMPRATHGQRQERVAKLQVSAGKVALQRPRYLDDLPEQLRLNVVYVQEVDAPAGADPVAWVLVTSESIDTPAQVEAVVDHYRARWLIEEFFKALKTGCAFEKRQLESFETLTNALALFFPIAWQMLLLRTLSRLDPHAPASDALTPAQIQVLQHYQPQKMPLKGATVKDALYAVAGLGGHLKNNGAPGWRTLAHGMQDLATMADVWEAATAVQAKASRNL
jgi:hypothetical protein